MGGARALRIILFAIFSVPGMDLPEARGIFEQVLRREINIF